MSEGVSYLELEVFAVASVNHGGTAADGGAVEVVGAAELGGGGESRGIAVAVLSEQIGAYTGAVVALIVVGVEETAFVTTEAGGIVGTKGGEASTDTPGVDTHGGAIGSMCPHQIARREGLGL